MDKHDFNAKEMCCTCGGGRLGKVRDGNAAGKHPLKGSDPPAPRLESWSQWGTIIIQSIEAIEAESGHAPALRSHPNQF